MLKKYKIYGLITAAALTLSITVVGASSLSNDLLTRPSADKSYTLTLNNENKFTGSSSVDIWTDSHADTVSFSYSNCATYNDGHATINNGGIIQNTQQITSITSFYVVYSGSGSLKIATSYDGTNFTSYYAVSSESEVTLNSRPYYIRMQATGVVNLNSARYTYSCTENDDIPLVELKNYVRVKQSEGIKAGDRVVLGMASDLSSSTLYTLTNTYETATPWYLKSVEATISDEEITYNSSTMTLWTVGESNGGYTFTADSGENYLRVYSDGSHYNVVCKDSDSSYVTGNNVWNFNFVTDKGYEMKSNHNSSDIWLRFSGTKYNNFKGWQGSAPTDWYVSLFKEVTSYTPDGSVPVDITDFTVSDTGSYTTASIYDSAKALKVHAIYSDGSEKDLTGGYTYVVKNQSGDTVSTNEAFGTQGTYTVYVTVPGVGTKSTEISVERNLVMENISISMSKTTFTTDDEIIGSIDLYLSGIIEYNFSDANVNGGYAALSAKGFAAHLEYNETSHSTSGKFTDAGTFYLTLTNGELTSNTVTLIVNEILVSSVSVTPETLELSTKSAASQLSVEVSPSNATNKEVTWSSNNTAVATVSSSGLVTPKGEGTATITATAKDSSGESDTCVVTVTAPVQGAENGTYTYLSSGAPALGSYVLITSDHSGTFKAMSKTQNSNNRAAVDVTSTSSGGSYTLERDENSTFAAFLVGQGTTEGTYSFYDVDAEGYLYAASSGSNYLRTETTLSANSSWTISNDGSATILAQGSNTRKDMRYNPGNNPPIFSCYATSQSTTNQPHVQLFNKAGEAIYPTSITFTSSKTNIAVGEEVETTVGFEPASTTVKNVTYESNHTNIATVDASGVITGVAEGDARITATAQKKSGTATAYIDVHVSIVAVSSITLDKSSATVKSGKTVTLNATVNPDNTTNKAVTWSSSNTAIASVTQDGVVSGVAAGTATITVKSQADNTKKAECTVTVTASSGGEKITSTSDLSVGNNVILVCEDVSKELSGITTSGTIYGTGESYSDTPEGAYELELCQGSSSDTYAFKTSDNTYLNWSSGNTLTTVSSIGNNSSWSITFSSGNAVITNKADSSRRIVWNVSSPRFATYAKNPDSDSGYNNVQLYTGTPTTPVYPTSMSMDPSACEVGIGGTKQLSVSFSAGTNQKNVTWESSNTSYAIVSNKGLVNVVDNSSNIGKTVTITATSAYTQSASVKASCTITITEAHYDAHTILIYMCGSDLESGSGFATSDLDEIISTSGQPDNVNIVVQTGGSSINNTYFSKTQFKRYHLSNKQWVSDGNIAIANMGESSTLQAFIEWGVTKYPADKIGLILWNHGGAMGGVCVDKLHEDSNGYDDSLSAAEVIKGVSDAKTTLDNNGVHYSYEWIGYDACLMGVSDIAAVNADYFNYMIASEELEAGEGWDYDNWLPTFYSDPTDTVSFLKKTCDSFISDNGGSNSSNDSTLAVYDLSKMSNYVSIFNTWASSIIGSSSQQSSRFSTLKTIYQSSLRFGDQYHAGENLNSVVDGLDFVKKIKSNNTFSGVANTDLVNALTVGNSSSFIIYNKYGGYYSSTSKPCGTTIFFAGDDPVSDGGYQYPAQTWKSQYTTSDTKFTAWRTFNLTYGNWFDS